MWQWLLCFLMASLGTGLALVVVVVNVAAGCCHWLAVKLRGWADAIDRWVASL